MHDLEKKLRHLAINIEMSPAQTQDLADFVNTQVSWGLTLVQGCRNDRSLGQLEDTEAERDLTAAREALSQARKFLPVASFTNQEKQAVQKRIAQLEKLLKST